MSISIPTIASLESGITAYFVAAFPNADHGPYSYFGQRARTWAQALLGIYQAVQDADRDAIPNSQTSSARLDEFAILFGLPDGSGTAGQYGRLAAIAATGGTASLSYSGAGGTPYTLPITQTFLAPDGATVLFLATAEVYAAAGTQTIAIDATTAGTVGNLPVDTVLRLQSPPAGFPSTVTLTGALSGGVAEETDAALLVRIFYRLQNPPKAITAPDLKQLAETVTGIVDAYVYPRRLGTGTASVVPMKAGAGSGRRPSAAEVTSVQTVLDANRNVGAHDITALRAELDSAHTIEVTARLSTETPWDWDDTVGGPWTVDTYPSGGDTFLKLSTTAPTDFKAAIDAGSRPTIQVVSAASVTPTICECTGWSDGGGKTTLTLSEAPTVAPVAGEDVYAATSWLSDVYEDLVAHVDEDLGPSRLSGWADPDRYWEDTLRIDAVRRIVLDAARTDGLHYVTLISSVAIDGAGSDVQPDDTGIAPPAYLTLSSVLVRGS